MRWRRLIAVVAPAGLVAAVLVPAIALGWVGVSIASQRPIDIGVRAGSAEGVLLTTDAAARADGAPTTRLDARRGRLHDLCLQLRPSAPLLGELAIVLRVRGDVEIGALTLAVAEGDLDGVRLPRTVIGQAGPDGAGGAFALDTEGSTGFTRLRAGAHGLSVSDGLRLDALGLRAGGSC